MKYYLIVGEASGDLHASHLMAALRQTDDSAEFRFFGGDLMSAVGGKRVRHYRELAYMGFIPVLLHLRTIFKNMAMCKRDIVEWQPDALILVDYPGFNLDIAKYVHAKTNIPVYYYISPKIWAWKEWRIKNIKRDVDEMFSILPFEVPFFEQKHHYPIHYVGNPTAEEVRQFQGSYHETAADFCRRHGLPNKPIIALLAGSRRQEIKDNLPAMIKAASRFADYQLVLAGAPSIPSEYYAQFLAGGDVFRVPQVVCYETPLPKLIAFLRRHVLKVRYISLVNLIDDSGVVPELVADTFSVDNIAHELSCILPGTTGRDRMLEGYERIWQKIGADSPSQSAAHIIYSLVQQ